MLAFRRRGHILTASLHVKHNTRHSIHIFIFNAFNHSIHEVLLFPIDRWMNRFWEHLIIYPNLLFRMFWLMSYHADGCRVLLVLAPLLSIIYFFGKERTKYRVWGWGDGEIQGIFLHRLRFLWERQPFWIRRTLFIWPCCSWGPLGYTFLYFITKHSETLTEDTHAFPLASKNLNISYLLIHIANQEIGQLLPSFLN